MAASPPPACSPKQQYQHELDTGILLPDARQALAVDAFERLYRQLQHQRRRGFWPLRRRQPALKGIYLYGSVGRGKTHLMDLFYDALPGQQKQRWHYHDFMRWVHDRLRQAGRQRDPLAQVVKDLGRRAHLLCLDEFLVNDIADAMLLAGLLRHLQAAGITLVTTSNVAPQDLYKDGLQRARFVPAIDWLCANMQVIHLDGETDFRYRRMSAKKNQHARNTGNQTRHRWIFPDDTNAHRGLSNWWRQLTGAPEPPSSPPLNVNGHWLPITAVSEHALWTGFHALCGESRHSNDYLVLADQYTVLLLESVSVMNDTHNDAARRFITLVDVLYDRNISLIASAEAHFSRIYQGQRLAFEFKRTVSRLTEMQGWALSGPCLSESISPGVRRD